MCTVDGYLTNLLWDIFDILVSMAVLVISVVSETLIICSFIDDISYLGSISIISVISVILYIGQILPYRPYITISAISNILVTTDLSDTTVILRHNWVSEILPFLASLARASAKLLSEP